MPVGRFQVPLALKHWKDLSRPPLAIPPGNGVISPDAAAILKAWNQLDPSYGGMWVMTV